MSRSNARHVFTAVTMRSVRVVTPYTTVGDSLVQIPVGYLSLKWKLHAHCWCN